MKCESGYTEKNQFDKVEIIQEMRTDAAPPEDEEKESESKH